MTINGKEYTNTKMCVWLVNRFGEQSREWNRVYEGADGKHYIKHGSRMAALEEFKVYRIGSLI